MKRYERYILNFFKMITFLYGATSFAAICIFFILLKKFL